MPSVAQVLRTSEQVRAEIEQTFGFFPPFFEPALGSPQVLENLWQQTLSAYALNPLSALFKEKLNALLSRFCAAPYCIIVHSAALRPLGMTAKQVLALLDAPPSDPTTELPLGGLPVPTPEEAAAPTPDSLLEKTLLYCATSVFLERADAPACQAELRRLLGPRLYSHLVAYLAYIKTCHTWIEAHPEVSHEADRRAQDNLGPLLVEEPALGDFFLHYQERVRAQGLGRERRRAADETLRAEQARTAAILESITDAFFALDSAWRFTYLNDQAERLLSRTRADLLGRNVWAEFPAAVGSDFDRQYHHAVGEQTAVTFEAYYPPPLDTWFEVRAFPAAEGLSVYFHDITERVGRLHRERFLADLAERARVLTDPEEVIADAVRSLGEFLGVSRCLFADIDIEADTCAVPLHYRADDSVASIAGVFPISAFGPFVVAEYKAGRTAVVDDVRADGIKAPPESLAAYEAIGVRAYVAAPVLHSTRLVSALAVHSPVPRRWKAEEVELLQTVVERTWLTVEVTRQARALVREAEERREAGERTARILEGITDAFFTVDRDWRYSYVNRQVEALWGRTREELLGMTVWEAWPQAVGTVFHAQFHRAMTEGVPISFEEFFPPLDAWLEVRVNPSTDGLSVFFQNVTQRKATAEALRRSQEDLRLATDAARLGTFYCDYPLDKIVWNDTCKQHFFLPPDAEVNFTLFYSLLHPDDREPTRRAIEQAMEERVAYDVEYRTLAPDGRARWVNAVGRFYYGPDGTPTRFDGITIDISARKGAEEEVRQRAEREALLNRVGAAIRRDPNQVLETAVQELGVVLGADRCYYAAYDQAADTATVGPEWHQDGLPSIAGQYPMSRFAVNRDPVYRAGRTQVVADTAGDPATEALGLRALVRVPLVSGVAMTALSVAMAGRPRAWTPDEVSLVEAVATQTQSALEAVRVQRREHAIAQQLQDALQPALPERVLGLSVGRFTKPALDEAQIGGDFFDIFPLDKELYAIVLGDVSGKGLAAAQQLALVRNSLRTTLYLYRSPAQAATALNRIVTSHDLLVGFVTAWVGVYDALTGKIAYCSCGHEPGLTRRANRGVEETETTGPPLGVAENAEYGEKNVTLASGDALLLYTDGLSEAGPNRRELLGTDGLARMLGALAVDQDVQGEAEMLVAQVGEATGGVFRDDVAVLLMRRE